MDLFKEYMARAYCMRGESGLINTHLLADIVISLSYFAIPIVLFYIVRRHRQMVRNPTLLYLFAAFIILCGCTHVMNIIAIWHTFYWLDAIIKLLTAFFSIITAIMLPLAFIKIIRAPEEVKKLIEEVSKTRESLDELKNFDNGNG